MSRSLLFASLACAAAAGGCRERATARDGRAALEGGTHDSERLAMVRRQLEPRGIRDPRVLHAMRTVPRHAFVPEPFRREAYADRPLPIGRGQTISQPYIVAFMAEELHLRPGDRILEVGSGSGYAAAVLSLLGSEVYGIELEQELLDRSVAAIRELGYVNVRLRQGDGFRGWPEKAPFDAIVISCAAEEAPAPLLEQLSEGGRLIYPKGGADDVQYLVLVTKTRGGTRERILAPVRFVPMRRQRRSCRRPCRAHDPRLDRRLGRERLRPPKARARMLPGAAAGGARRPLGRGSRWSSRVGARQRGGGTVFRGPVGVRR